MRNFSRISILISAAGMAALVLPGCYHEESPMAPKDNLELATSAQSGPGWRLTGSVPPNPGNPLPVVSDVASSPFSNDFIMLATPDLFSEDGNTNYGHRLYRLGQADQWSQLYGAGTSLDFHYMDGIMVVGGDKRLYSGNGSTWIKWSLPTGEPGLSEIGAGGGSPIWALGSSPHPTYPSAKKVYRNNGRWELIVGAAKRVDVDRFGAAWIVGADDKIYRYEGTRFVQISDFQALDIGVSETAAFAVGKSIPQYVYKYSGSLRIWYVDPDGMHGAQRITVSPFGKAMVSRTDGSVYVQN